MLCARRVILLLQTKKGVFTMDFAHKANKAIECNVVSCRNHCDSQDYCSLDHVRIGTHECHPSMDQCTDCLSFIQK